ncbi:Nn.00g038720.m01.CDS01 [Neocucurbitaria sp. VM-36]
MFSDEDVKEIFQGFTLPEHLSAAVPSLIVASDDHGFLTFQHLEAEFKAHVTQGTHRIPVSLLARDLNIEHGIVRQLAHTHSSLSLLSLDNSDVITLDERDALHRKLAGLLSGVVVSKLNFATQNDVDVKSIDALLAGLDMQLVGFDDYVCSKSYEDSIWEAILRLLERSLEGMQSIEIVPRDLPGTPPISYVLRTLKKLLDSPNLAEKFHVRAESSSIHCAPKQLTEHKRDARIDDLHSGALAYVNLQDFWKDFPELFATLEDVHGYFQRLSKIEIMDAFAVSTVRISSLVRQFVQMLQEDGYINLTHVSQDFPESLRDRVAQNIERNIFATFEESSEPKPYRVGDFMLTEAHRDKERAVLLEHAKADASAQWQQLKDNFRKELKFNSSNITAVNKNENSLQSFLVKEKVVERALDEQFWSTVSERETQNEVEFSKFWLERAVSRCHVYNEGLSTVEDQKLCDQLAELLASHIQKELLPDSLSKARSQGLVLSRRTRKNTARLETILKAGKMDTTSVLAALNSFNRKQNIEPLANSKLEEAKKAMMSDMVRRMQKQKQSDGPLLFLTLTLILFARQYAGVVYATGKFAPKLLKQLKSSLEPEQYEQLEKWKEAAKAGTLSAEERQDMKKMAET